MDDDSRAETPDGVSGGGGAPDREVEGAQEVEEDEWGQVAPPAAAGSAAGAGSSPGRRRVLLIVGLAAALAAGILGYWRFWGRAPAPEPVVEAPPPEPEAPPEDERVPLPPLDESDGFLRAILSALADHPDAAGWLLGDDLARRIVVAVENVADGVSPRRALAGLGPADSFRVAGEGEYAHVHPDSFARYDSVASAIGGADLEGLARTAIEVRPLMEIAYAELGRPDRTFADALLLALDRLSAVPVPEEPLLVRQRVLRFEYRDPALESLDDASKHLLRFGPENQRRIQDALTRFARLFREALAAG